MTLPQPTIVDASTPVFPAMSALASLQTPTVVSGDLVGLPTLSTGVVILGQTVGAVPDTPGVGWTLPGNEAEVTLPENRPHFHIPEKRAHFVIPTE